MAETVKHKIKRALLANENVRVPVKHLSGCYAHVICHDHWRIHAPSRRGRIQCQDGALETATASGGHGIPENFPFNKMLQLIGFPFSSPADKETLRDSA